MAEMHTDPFITHSIAESAAHGPSMVPIALVIGVAALLGLLFLWLRQPPLVGFILAGVALGPTGLGAIGSSENVALLAEMGVVVLLFFIGMELSIKAFILSLRQALLVAGSQIAVALLVGAAAGYLLDSTVAEAIILGFIFAMSSTVVAMKMLDEMGVLRAEAGRIAVGVLIAQDIAVVPMLIFVTSLGGEETRIAALVTKTVIALALLGGLLWWFGRHNKLRIPFAEAVQDKIEILALGSLAICFIAAALSGALGLSAAYGAFLSGLVVGNTNLRSRVIPVIEPIQSVLLVAFFLSIGLLIDLDFIWGNLWGVLAVSLVVIAAKTVLNVFLLRRTGASQQTALVAGLSMAQIGEFSFVLASAGFSVGALGYDNYRVAIAITAVTLLLSPFWTAVMHRLENMASTHLETYREAIAIAYAREFQVVGRQRILVLDAVWAVKVRYRAVRKALRKGRRQRHQEL
ncbi:cation:proton antiporter [Rhizobium sp. TRM95111]|uniref:cation:proton antiporter n=1 Tax=Rhizobium alarense TaxID=2846851 RepID=UPI001F2824A8|nr:cation:proton antiporter [Rhizobium alarense]MCF3639355.1 cation:proton antiporter [Rhizobium alarense]